MPKILIVGSVAFDTLHLAQGSFPKVLGGSATYASLAASHFAGVQLVGVVGKDFPQSAIDDLKGRGVDTAGLEIAEGETFHWEGRYTPDLVSRTSLRTDLNVFAAFQPKIPEAYRDTKYVMLGNIAPELQLDVLDQIRQPKFVIADTMNFWIDSKPAELAKVLRRIDLLVINEEEARQLSGKHHIAEVARELGRMGPKTVIVKRGEYGAMLFHEDCVFSAPGYPLETVLDPTGAGDSFAGGLIGYLARHDDLSEPSLRRAVIHGSTLASFSVEGVAVDRLLKLTTAEVGDRVKRFRRLVEFDHA
ncbi:MAG: PfkB family carbohydrate kinase [Polyangiales bacterium]